MKSVCQCILFALLAMCPLGGSSLPAQIISPNNPYRSFNIHGINYGSMRWEQEQARKRGTPVRVQPVMRSCRRRR